MNVYALVGLWVMLIHDSPAPPWEEAMPLGSGYEITVDADGAFMYLPGPGVKSPMDQPTKLTYDRYASGQFPAGKPLQGGLYADFGGDVGIVYFTVNRVGRTRRVMSLTSVNIAGVGTASEVQVLTHGGSHSVDD